MPRLPPRPDLQWTEEGVPRALAFDDVYFSRAGGLAETEAVFCAGCDLPAAWSARRAFTIVELGFGTGLNALAVRRLWRKTRPPGGVLHFVSIESAPLDAADAARALAAFPELESDARALLAAWPVRADAPQRLWFEAEGFALTILIGDARAALAGFAGRADCWFLDGFTPARNEAMWSAPLMRLVAARSAPGARLATYSVAGEVRRNLQAAGFTAAKRPGFGAKRERLEARLETPPPTAPSLYPYGAAEGPVAIIGGGIAGASLAHALKRRGRECFIVEAHDGAGASFNRAALVMPRLDRGAAPIADLHRAAYLAAIRFYAALGALEPCGVREIARDAAAMADLLADPPLPPDWFAPAPGGARHPRAGLVRPPALIECLRDGIETRAGDARALEAEEGAWRVLGDDGAEIARAACVVLANGASLARFAQAAWLPLRLSRGQLEWIKGPRLIEAIASGAYAAPCDDGIIFGATFDAVESDAPPMADESSLRRNLEALRTLAPELLTRIHDERNLVSRASLRATTPDRAPILGLLPDFAAWRAQNAGVAFGRAPPRKDAPCLTGLYAFGGLGARGFTLAPFLAEDLASEICGEPFAASRAMRDAIHPARFLHRMLKRREGISA